MHNYLRAIGFSNLQNEKDIKEILTEVFHDFDEREVSREGKNKAFVEYTKSFGENMGIKMCGIMDTDGFHQEYYFPYFQGKDISSKEDLIIERHAARESFAGVCEDVRIGVSVIFYLQNAAKYKKEMLLGHLLSDKISTSFSGLSLKGKILFPVQKAEPRVTATGSDSANQRHKMIAAARQGDAEAIESLTLEDIDTYAAVNQRILKEDLFSIVDTLFMPYGLECDHYQVMGNIKDVEKTVNKYTKETIYQLRLECNDMNLDRFVHDPKIFCNGIHVDLGTDTAVFTAHHVSSPSCIVFCNRCFRYLHLFLSSASARTRISPSTRSFAVILRFPYFCAAASPAHPCRKTASFAASNNVIPCAVSPANTPVSTSPEPAVAMPLFPEVLM